MSAPASPEVLSQIEAIGAGFRPFPVQRNGLNPLKDLHTFFRLYKTFRQTQPDIILAYTIKPVIWGGLAASLFSSVRFYGLITGLGFAFEGKGMKRKVLQFMVSWLYRLALLKARRVIFQNPDNQDTFVNSKIVPATKCVVVNGSGVNLKHFNQIPFSPAPPVFLLMSRLLGEKGIREYVLAAKKVKKIYSENLIY